MATRPYARPRPHLLCFHVLPWSQRASRHDSIAMAGSAVDRKGPGAAVQGTRRRYTDQSIGAEHSVRIQLSLFCRLEQPVQPFSGWWMAHSLHGGV